MAEAEGSGFAPGFAPAKINLTLHVTGQRADGLHLLDSLVAFADVGDRLKARVAERSSLLVVGAMAEGVPVDESNLVLKAAEWMGVPAAFTLDKRLPAAAGIGGGSSDAAAALRLLAGLKGRDLPNGTEVLGADVPVCMVPRAMRMRGIGEVLGPVDLPPLPAVLVNPGVAVPTGGVFAGLARKDNPPMPQNLPQFAGPVEAAGWIAQRRNDLEAPAIALEPVIGELLALLATLPGVLLARMSGSGATCFALFVSDEAARAAAAQIRDENPGFWCETATLR
ncbi:4-(cytidine 5'-diphospho)-2-C-methyl-D-erythritol kinase [Alisedimentitalea sp. MJ-SS2]|uniref:4-(cytidine 5'-diphospho)-2-C-methyl-D-erythritol kinase n=1 Tax=Aliisedimentitalea sp. MJ-SS2 TaxID=3049795 RepID=UPI0029083105|nr:4-(cytidine 5'-diphospho)-2-C-methyl-D-erythritol kinase [Alisedimentitalea sp. MJ-SS2]MDU8928450.1 4-(cytidine 5'-diphospho)-2-C-methyl-D-erythritol kinase [Alisedimentitalea sp. MJ-SS2]